MDNLQELKEAYQMAPSIYERRRRANRYMEALESALEEAQQVANKMCERFCTRIDWGICPLHHARTCPKSKTKETEPDMAAHKPL